MSSTTERKLAAIMFTDIAGYTAQMSKDEARAMELLKEKESILKPLLEEYKGTFVKSIGDGTLSYFESAINAASCAVRLQELTYDQEDLNIRAGIHIGDIVFKDDDVFGDGVNISARLESMAPVGGVCVSKNVYDELMNQKGFEGVDLGLQSLKGVGRLVEVYGLKGSKLKEPNPNDYKENKVAIHKDDEVPSIAVIPFDNKGADEDVFYAYGISSDLIGDISSSGKIRVAGLKEIEELGDIPFKEKAIQLNVRYVSTGLLWKMGEMFQLSIELHDTKENTIIWSDRWQEKWENLTTIKEKLSSSLLEALNTKPKLAPSFINNNSEAYEYYLKAKYKIEKQEKPEDFTIGIELVEKAMDLDDDLIEAKLLRIRIHGIKGEFKEFVKLSDKVIEKAKSANQKKYLALAYITKGIQLFMQNVVIDNVRLKDTTQEFWDEILDNFKQACQIAKETNNIKQLAKAKFLYAIVYRSQGKINDELNCIKESIEINKKIDDWEGLSHNYFEIGNTYKEIGDYSKSLEYTKKGLSIVNNKDLVKEVLMYTNCINISLIRDKNLSDQDLEKLYEDAEKLAKSYSHEIIVLADIYVSMALIQILKKDYSKAIKVLSNITKLRKNLEFCGEQGLILELFSKKCLGDEISSDLDKLEKEIKEQEYSFPYWIEYYRYKLYEGENGKTYLQNAVDEINQKKSNLDGKVLEEFSSARYVELISEEWDKINN